MKKNINEYDMSKKMMEVLRGGYKTLLKEDQSEPTNDELIRQDPNLNPDPEPEQESEDTLSVQPGDTLYKTELDELKNQLETSAEITNFKIYPTNNNVLLEGTLLNGNLSFILEKISDEGTIETVGSYGVGEEASGLMTKFHGFFKIWKQKWDKKIEEYKGNRKNAPL